MAQEETQQMIWLLKDDVDVLAASTDKAVMEGLSKKLEDEYLSVVPVPILTETPEKIFVVTTLERDTGEEDALNYWFREWPYDEDFVFIDDTSFEVGVKCDSVEEATKIALQQWAAYLPMSGADWPTGDFPLIKE